MIELVVLGTLVFAAVVVFGALAMVGGLVGWFLTLPFRIVGWAFKLVGFLIALPVLLFVGLLVGVVTGGALLFTAAAILLPMLPIVALAALLWWLFRGRKIGRASWRERVCYAV